MSLKSQACIMLRATTELLRGMPGSALRDLCKGLSRTPFSYEQNFSIMSI